MRYVIVIGALGILFLVALSACSTTPQEPEVIVERVTEVVYRPLPSGVTKKEHLKLVRPLDGRSEDEALMVCQSEHANLVNEFNLLVDSWLEGSE